jgi:hypothetical protein
MIYVFAKGLQRFCRSGPNIGVNPAGAGMLTNLSSYLSKLFAGDLAAFGSGRPVWFAAQHIWV